MLFQGVGMSKEGTEERQSGKHPTGVVESGVGGRAGAQREEVATSKCLGKGA